MKTKFFVLFVVLSIVVLTLTACQEGYKRPAPSPEWEVVPESEKTITHDTEVPDLRIASFEVYFQLDSTLYQAGDFASLLAASELCIGDRYLKEAAFHAAEGYMWTKTCTTDYGGPGWELTETE